MSEGKSCHYDGDRCRVVFRALRSWISARAFSSASLELIESEGLAALSMREVARRAGVSHQAPYHHFADREAILAALVLEGFTDLASRLDTALAGATKDDVAAAVRRAGVAYVQFALDRPGLFKVMFRPELVDHERFPEAEQAGSRAFGALERLVELSDLSGSTDARTSFFWSIPHGLATLLIDGKLGAVQRTKAEREAHAEEVLDLFAEMVALRSDATKPKKKSASAQK